MNGNFQKWVTSAAFNIQLSVPQIKTLKALAKAGGIAREAMHPLVLAAMERRGLVEFVGSQFVALSRAGTLLQELVVEAGITDEFLGMSTATDRALVYEPKLHPALEMKAGGMDNHEIAMRLNIKVESVQTALRRHQRSA